MDKRQLIGKDQADFEYNPYHPLLISFSSSVCKEDPYQDNDQTK